MAERASRWSVVQGIALIITGYFAALGVSLACALKNLVAYGAVHPPLIAAESGIAPYLVMFTVMVLWIVAAFLFAWRNRNRVGLSLASVALLIFVFSAVNMLRTAYPACNAF